MHAEPTVFGLKFLGFLEEIRRNREHLARAFAGLEFGHLQRSEVGEVQETVSVINGPTESTSSAIS